MRTKVHESMGMVMRSYFRHADALSENNDLACRRLGSTMCRIQGVIGGQISHEVSSATAEQLIQLLAPIMVKGNEILPVGVEEFLGCQICKGIDTISLSAPEFREFRRTT